MKKAIFGIAVIMAMSCGFYNVSHAVPVFSTGAGSAVTSVDLSANFDTLVQGQSLVNYTENGLIVDVNDRAFTEGYLSGQYYGWSGNNDFVSIYTLLGETMQALEMQVGSGFGQNVPVNIYWETWRGGSLTGSGTQDSLQAGGIFGWSDTDGIDQLWLAAYGDTGVSSFGGLQAIAIDDLIVQTGTAPIPEPTTVALLGIGLVGLAGAEVRRRRKKKAVD